MQQEAYGEVFLIDKPYQWTSFDVVKKVRNALKIKKVGHAGTLDPLATGLLIVCAGKKTKSIDSYMAQEKEYTGTFILGKTTESFDLEKEVTDVSDPFDITFDLVKSAVAQLTGDILQIPPMHSAIKVDGKRVYESARKGIEVKMEARLVTVSEFEITSFENPEVQFRIVCSKGTYIRSLARDMGRDLGCYGHIAELRRVELLEQTFVATAGQFRRLHLHQVPAHALGVDHGFDLGHLTVVLACHDLAVASLFPRFVERLDLGCLVRATKGDHGQVGRRHGLGCSEQAHGQGGQLQVFEHYYSLHVAGGW